MAKKKAFLFLKHGLAYHVFLHESLHLEKKKKKDIPSSGGLARMKKAAPVNRLVWCACGWAENNKRGRRWTVVADRQWRQTV